MNKDIATPLVDAMMLLEISLDPGCEYKAADMTWAALSLVQQAWQRSLGIKETLLPSSTNELLAKIHADSAIEIAMQKGARNE